MFKKGAGATKTTILSAAPLNFKRDRDQSIAYRIVASVKTPTAAVRAYLDVILANTGATDIAFLAIGIQKEGRDPRAVPLAVPVDAAVALLKPDETPRDVEVDQLMALKVEIDALRCDVAREEYADRGGLLLEGLDDVLLLDVAQAAV